MNPNDLLHMIADMLDRNDQLDVAHTPDYTELIISPVDESWEPLKVKVTEVNPHRGFTGNL